MTNRVEPSTSAAPKRSGAKRIGLFGIYGTGNFGNDGSLEAMVRFLQRALPGDELLCICTGPDEVRRTLGIDAVPIYYQPADDSGSRLVHLAKKAAGRAVMWVHALRQTRRLKAIIVPGMGALDDFAVSPFGWPLDLMTWFLIARLMGAKVVLANIGAGPIAHPLSRVFLKTAARLAHYRSFRDQVSKDFVAGLGIDVSRDPVVPDIAFCLPAPAHAGTAAPPLTVGVGVMTYYGWQKGAERVANPYQGYVEKMARYIGWLLDNGHRVRLIMGDEIDDKAVDDILARVRETHPDGADSGIAFAPAHGLADVMQQMADIDVAVVTRFHNLVCALKMGRPTISIGYQAKNDALLAAMGMTDFCLHIERFDVDTLQALTDRMIANRAEDERKIEKVRARFAEALKAQEATLVSLIEGKG